MSSDLPGIVHLSSRSSAVSEDSDRGIITLCNGDNGPYAENANCELVECAGFGHVVGPASLSGTGGQSISVPPCESEAISRLGSAQKPASTFAPRKNAVLRDSRAIMRQR